MLRHPFCLSSFVSIVNYLICVQRNTFFGQTITSSVETYKKFIRGCHIVRILFYFVCKSNLADPIICDKTCRINDQKTPCTSSKEITKVETRSKNALEIEKTKKNIFSNVVILNKVYYLFRFILALHCKAYDEWAQMIDFLWSLQYLLIQNCSQLIRWFFFTPSNPQSHTNTIWN